MIAPVKLTKAEGIALATALADRVGHAQVLTALVAVLGTQRALDLAERQDGRISKAETLALVKAILPLLPGDTLKAKIKTAISALRESIPDKARADAILAYVLERIQAYKAGPMASSAPATWDACTRASCWNGSNAQQRMMNILSPAFTAEKFAQYRDWMLSIGCNTAHVFLSNRSDGEGAGYSIYSGEWSWKIDAGMVNLMLDRMADLRAHGLAVIPWLFADDSAAWNSSAAKDFPRYLADLKANKCLEKCPTVVAGLELDEYYSSAQVSALVNSIRKVYSGKVGTHEASGYKFAALGDIVFLQTDTGRTPAQIKAAVESCRANTGKPVNCFEIERQPASKAQIEAAFAGGAYAVGNWNGTATVNIADQTGGGNVDSSIKPSQVKWLGTNYANAKTTVALSGVSMSGTHLNFKASPAPPWPPNGAKKCRAVGFLIRKIGGQYVGGKVEWCVVERGWFDIVANTGNYNGSTVPANGETCWAGLGHPTNGSEVSTLLPFTWKTP